MGYHRAGFDVTGVDIAPQPRYPFTFHQGDAMTWPLDGYDVIHASPPCQYYSQMSNSRPGLADTYPDLVEPTRALLERSGLPYVMENVMGAGLADATDLHGRFGVLLCGSMFGLRLYRHRAFETSQPFAALHHPRHDIPASKAGHWQPGTIISVSGHTGSLAVAKAAMGIDWMIGDELSEAIPPAYTEHIGAQLLDHLQAVAS